MSKRSAKILFWVYVALTVFSVLFVSLWGYEGTTGEAGILENVYYLISNGLLFAAIFDYAYSRHWFGEKAVIAIMVNTVVALVYDGLSVLIPDYAILSTFDVRSLIIIYGVGGGLALVCLNSLRKEARLRNAPKHG